MNHFAPIHTEQGECQDCHKCVRICPVKAVRLEGGHASVITERCILCGACVAVCPRQAKKVRNDLPRARRLLEERPQVVLSLAPSWVSEFPEASAGQLIAAARKLGFFAVSETALGAQEVSAHVAELLVRHPVLLSSACPTAVAYLQKYDPRHASLLSPLLSPLLAHARLLREQLGAGIGVVFAGPCIGKKAEGDAHPELLDVALTFSELRRWFAASGIELTALQPEAADVFFPGPAEEGALYPVEGGMIAGVRDACPVTHPAFLAFAGLEGMIQGLDGIEEAQPPGPGQGGVFVELLACRGGCIAGPCTAARGGTGARRLRVLRHASAASGPVPRRPTTTIAARFEASPLPTPTYGEREVRAALRTVGKQTDQDELDCGSCGYETCRDFARALLDGKAERAMCISHMRALAMKKANALLRKMPSAVVIVDAQLKIIECNEHFARMAAGRGGREAALTPAGPGTLATGGGAPNPAALEGVPLSALPLFSHVAARFASVLQTGEDILDRDLRCREATLHGSIFSIERNLVVGGIFQDVTHPAEQKQQVIAKARQVIQKNLSTVQQIAFLLGENAAESENILESIIDSFSTGLLAEEEPPAPSAAASRAPQDDPDGWKRAYRG